MDKPEQLRAAAEKLLRCWVDKMDARFVINNDDRVRKCFEDRTRIEPAFGDGTLYYTTRGRTPATSG